MRTKQKVGLTASEIAALWSAYISCSMAICLSQYFSKYLEDKEARSLLEESLKRYQAHLKNITHIFTEEKFPVPRGYNDDDVDLSAPSLFFGLFPLSYVYSVSRMDLISYSAYTTSAAREDVRALFSDWMQFSLEMFNKATDLMLSKGIYDRPAFIPYPEHVSFMNDKPGMLTEWFKPKRPLNVLEISDIFFNLERNNYAVILLTGFSQIIRDDQIKQYLLRGKKLANKHIEFLNEILIQDDLLGNNMVNTDVTTSTVSPFSERLILGIITLTNSAAVSFLGRSLSTATRTDLTVEYSKLLLEVLKYGKDGMDLLIERGWMEEPPHAPDRKKLAGV
ncbi:DUF3231 family protein [Paenibacillus sepulcri]|uniref:DUF3231 family protein n=1 Tax=Paenibacillus sepulcri TaxID=359917 RepID=A0ABS7BZ95_9BACL|nr:DUF3231 family protein [Paenibacillus sepulcri]